MFVEHEKINHKLEEKTSQEKNEGHEDLSKTITHCPSCGVSLTGNEYCKSINCPCAPRITC